MKIYLAGPEVFLPNAGEIGDKKKKICSRYGHEGLFPLDVEVSLEDLSAREKAQKIFEGNIGLMNEADCIIANATPFRGPSMDVGTSFEVGYMYGLAKPVVCYTNNSRGYKERAERGDRRYFDTPETNIENFDLPENLMIPGAAVRFFFPLGCLRSLDDLRLFEDILGGLEDALVS